MRQKKKGKKNWGINIIKSQLDVGRQSRKFFKQYCCIYTTAAYTAAYSIGIGI